VSHLGEESLRLLTELVEAYQKPHPATKAREPIFFFRVAGGSHLQHHGLGDAERSISDADLEELAYGGLLDIDYGRGTWKLVPTPAGRQVVAHYAAATDTTLAGSVEAFLEVAETLHDSANPLAWDHGRPLLRALRDYWEEAGLPAEGIRLRPLIHALPEDHFGRTAALLRRLVASGYLDAASDVELQTGIPAVAALGPRSFELLDGWPSTDPSQLYERLLEAINAEAASTDDAGKKRVLQRLGESVREIGVSTAGEILAKVVTGG
jgi:hypothetical protein